MAAADPGDGTEPPGDGALAEELRRVLLARIKDYTDLVSDIRGGLDESKRGLRKALELVASYPPVVQANFEDDWERRPDVYRVFTVRWYLKHLHERVQDLDDFLLRAVEADVPPSLAAAVERSCSELLGRPQIAVVTVGPADNFGTFVDDLEDWLFDELDRRDEGSGPDDGQDKSEEGDEVPPRFALLQVPRLAGADAPWRPILLGHEVAHLAVEAWDAQSRLELPADFDARAEEVELPAEFGAPELRTDALRNIMVSWLEELLCDAYLVRRFGPAGVAAMGSFFEAVDAQACSPTHPPGWFRLELMTRWVGEPEAAELAALVRPWQKAAVPEDPPPDWARYLFDVARELSDDVRNAVDEWGPDPAAVDERIDAIRYAHDQFTDGLPAVTDPSRDHAPLRETDIVTGGWVALTEGSAYPVRDLMAWSLDAVDFLEQWRTACQGTSAEAVVEVGARAASEEDAGALSETGIKDRLARTDDRKLVIAPLLRGAVDGSAVDLRLGNKFILFRSSRIEAFNPLSEGLEARAMQTYTEKRWGQTFVLHPNELVLANVLECIRLPGDLTGQVVTRSSYGRLGLVTATATHVHPHYRGSLTLELVNLSEVPLSLTPGQRVAQLALYQLDHVVPPPDNSKKYDCPTRPEFSKVHLDRDREVLERIREG